MHYFCVKEFVLFRVDDMELEIRVRVVLEECRVRVLVEKFRAVTCLTFSDMLRILKNGL